MERERNSEFYGWALCIFLNTMDLSIHGLLITRIVHDLFLLLPVSLLLQSVLLIKMIIHYVFLTIIESNHGNLINDSL